MTDKFKKRKEYLSKMKEHPLIIIVTSFGVPILALLWDFTIDNVDTIVIISMSLFMFIFIISIILIIQSILGTALKEEFYSKIDILQKFIESSGTGWISSDNELSLKEKTVKDITVVTSDMKNDIIDGDISQVVSENLEEGKKYLYIIPKTTKSLSLIEEYKRVHEFQEKQVRVIFIEEQDFHFLNEIVVYDLFNKKDIESYIVFPSNTHSLHIKLDKRHTNKIVGIVKTIIKTHKSFYLIDDEVQQELEDVMDNVNNTDNNTDNNKINKG